jgi:hypothetical protein
MNRLALFLLSSPTVFGSMLSMFMMVSPAHGAEPVPQGQQSVSCQRPPQISQLTCARMSQATREVVFTAPTEESTVSQTEGDAELPMLEFTEEESDTAVALYGCDCVACLNAVRQMRGLPPVS